MPCLFAGLAFFCPRVAIVLLVIFGDYIGRAYDSALWPLLGFFFMPYTTIAYAYAKNANGSVEGLYLALVVVGVLFDLGVMGGGSKQTVAVRSRRSRGDARRKR